MIKRIVKLTFREEAIGQFLAIFEENNKNIRHAPGCFHLELLRSVPDSSIFFTFSIWEDEKALEAYRQSDLFKSTWARTKKLFADKAEAWTVTEVERL
ncbi:MAG: antibiotic biosynthesis monooxygenase [Bacteroidetes bacterium]|nr:antibiotic biosynthesis monooxygenase [Bacteroidota bacterium]